VTLGRFSFAVTGASATATGGRPRDDECMRKKVLLLVVGGSLVTASRPASKVGGPRRASFFGGGSVRILLVTSLTATFTMALAPETAAFVPGFDSAYAGESAFVTLRPGETKEFMVFFFNRGTTAWEVGTTTQVDLAGCREDKVTCNVLDPGEELWNDGSWLSVSPPRYATHEQKLVLPGSIGTFRYRVRAPATAAPGTYRFNGDLVLSRPLFEGMSSGLTIHPEGYYHEATLTAGAPTAFGLPLAREFTPRSKVSSSAQP
jgi:hypothetical protein